MFFKCSSLKTLDVSHFLTTKVKAFDYMFFGCDALQGVDLSRFQA